MNGVRPIAPHAEGEPGDLIRIEPVGGHTRSVRHGPTFGLRSPIGETVADRPVTLDLDLHAVVGLWLARHGARLAASSAAPPSRTERRASRQRLLSV